MNPVLNTHWWNTLTQFVSLIASICSLKQEVKHDTSQLKPMLLQRKSSPNKIDLETLQLLFTGNTKWLNLFSILTLKKTASTMMLWLPKIMMLVNTIAIDGTKKSMNFSVSNHNWAPSDCTYSIDTNSTTMKLKQVTISSTEVSLANGTAVLFSYETPVAALVPGRGWLRTDTFHSKTTSKHINSWFAKNGGGGATTHTVSQSELDSLVAF